jgi:hypothetical protein
LGEYKSDLSDEASDPENKERIACMPDSKVLERAMKVVAKKKLGRKKGDRERDDDDDDSIKLSN